jgi:glycosyltransferase involved in cell wall biosynthesis
MKDGCCESIDDRYSMVLATVAICTYNGADRLGCALSALWMQTHARNEWELLVIDNASTDNTAEFAAGIIRQCHDGRGRVVREERPGLSFARARAAQEARGAVICFLDDDNIPTPHYISAVIEAFAQRPRAGVIGGKVLARWETEPTPLALAVAPFALAICDLGDSPLRVDGLGGGIVGAGLCVRADLLRDIFTTSRLATSVTDRKGTNLISGGDLAISIVAKQLGWECWYVPKLQIEHVLPAGRMNKDYLLRLYEGIGRGQAATRKCYDWKARSLLAWLLALKDFCRWVIGQWRGPSRDLIDHHPGTATDIHRLNQSLTLGRALQALQFRLPR